MTGAIGIVVAASKGASEVAVKGIDVAAKGVGTVYGDLRAVFSRLLGPALSETGNAIADPIANWRARNAAIAGAKAIALLELQGRGHHFVHPRVLHDWSDSASFQDDELMQSLFSGLLAAAATEDGKDQEILADLRLLDSLTPLQAALLHHLVQTEPEVQVFEGGCVASPRRRRRMNEVLSAVPMEIHVLDRHLDILRQLGLISAQSGFNVDESDWTSTEITLMGRGLDFYSRCMGHRGAPADYYRAAGKVAENGEGPGE